jgi:hypothetical protein
MADKYYTSEIVILEAPKGKDTFRVMVGEKNGKQALDIRTWYEDNFGDTQPGKGVSIPITEGLVPALAEVFTNFKEIAEESVKTGTFKRFNPKTGKLEDGKHGED